MDRHSLLGGMIYIVKISNPCRLYPFQCLISGDDLLQNEQEKQKLTRKIQTSSNVFYNNMHLGSS